MDRIEGVELEVRPKSWPGRSAKSEVGTQEAYPQHATLRGEGGLLSDALVGKGRS